jgi:putative phosphoesterase
MLIGLISDTHLPSERKTLWDEVYAAFKDVDLILHAGDIVQPIVLDWLGEIAPVLAARGNNDHGVNDPRIAGIQRLERNGIRLAMLHDMEPETRPIEELLRAHLHGERADIIVTGHTHFERIDYRDGVLQINPGSASLPHQRSTRLGTVALLEWRNDLVGARTVRLGETEGRPNPGREYIYPPGEGNARGPGL